MRADISRFSGAVWRTSTYSGSENQNCVQVTDGVPGILPVHDSKQPEGPVLVFGTDAWGSFISTLA
ncbi:DUF397 domain-containing protein [Streptomyces johnsoniae]|uniref:DUF397 domain-containing protein n=1 Tax=Streptomyces johnsoniae TaxID=3075532 RepID=A0ABU2S2N8_9ACTN|nr:DUF397 domain-containing protein [Streptomyces sp. DSM 41886]MDT0442064.1 DUF397 domain-containing protein [Streptomyces sp. DSM 41886]